MKMQRLSLILFILLTNIVVSAQAVALSEKMPAGCVAKSFSFSGKKLILNNDAKQNSSGQVFLFYNYSDTDLWLDHPVQHTGASAGWASNLTSKHWSALMVDKPNWEMVCQKNPNEKKSCKKVLKVCVLSNVKVKMNKAGTYWLAENLTIDSLITEIKRRGIELK